MWYLLFSGAQKRAIDKKWPQGKNFYIKVLYFVY